MGLLNLMKKIIVGDEKESGGPRGVKAKCPKCGESVDLSMKRCPSCGTHVDLLFRIKCPKCKTLNPIKNKYCSKCKEKLYDEQQEQVHRPQYICPICRYKADYYMLSCPACGTRFA
jgi:predicted amidophosphoribosyltransferase